MSMKNANKGASLLTFLVVMPFLVLLTVSVSEFGVLFYRMQALANSSQDAARYLSYKVSNGEFDALVVSDTEIVTAKNLVRYGAASDTDGNGVPLQPLVPGTITINISRPAADLDHVQVTAVHTHDLMFGGGLGALAQLGGASDFPGQLTLTSSSVMRFDK